MARSVKPALKRTISFKIDADVADRVKQFLRDNSGKPLYLRPGTFAEQALIDAIERIEREGDVEVGHPIKAFANVRGNGISRRV
jgi:hypothetical protein